MLKINRLRIEIHTNDGLYGSDIVFSEGLNVIASDDNTRGKSSTISAILYCLGCEELLGRQGSKVLTPVFTKQLEDDQNNVHTVLQSCVYLEITNGTEVITIYRSIKSEKREEKLITVYNSKYDNISDSKVTRKDYYVLLRHAATSNVGFHKFLSQFLNLQLPVVYDFQDNEHLLYIQQIIAALFIEQKSGWSDLLCRVPYYKVQGAKQRVVEYWLDIRNNEEDHIRRQLDKEEKDIELEWEYGVKAIADKLIGTELKLINIPMYPEVLTNEQINNVSITINYSKLADYILQLSDELSQLDNQEPLVQDNFDELQKELKETETQVAELHFELKGLQEQEYFEKQNIRKQKHSLCQIVNDIQNNKDAQKLKKLGAELDLNFAKDVCPVCKQHIDDALLPFETSVISIDDNLKHLNAQKSMLEYSINTHEKKIAYINQVIENNSRVLSDLEKIALSIRSDITSTEKSYSETIVRKKIMIKDKIDKCTAIQKELVKYKKSLKMLSDKWSSYLIKKEQLNNLHTNRSYEKISYLRKCFIDFLYAFNFCSIPNAQKARINISQDTLLPIIDEFDMKFGASASDNIRMIWAYTLALLIASVKYSKSKLNIAIFDEPKQQSIVDDDFKAFIQKALDICDEEKSQIILGVTAKGQTKNMINEIAKQGGNIIKIDGKAFKKLS